MSELIQVDALERSFGTGDKAVHVLRGIDLTVHTGELVALYGPSGSGKTTLLNLIGALDQPTGGAITIADQPITKMSENPPCQVSTAQYRLYFPKLYADAHLHRRREYRPRSTVVITSNRPAGAPPTHPSHTRGNGAECLVRPSARPTQWWSAPARGDCPCNGVACAACPRRRANQRPRYPHRTAGHGAVSGLCRSPGNILHYRFTRPKRRQFRPHNL